MTPPSGEQVELRRGLQTATVVAVGAGLRGYRVGDRDVVDGYARDEMAPAGAGQALIPWPNRVRGGTYDFGGRQQLAIDEPERNCAIHGLTRWENWDVAAREEDRATFRLVLHPRPGYPFTLQVQIEYALGELGLSVRWEAVNEGAADLPLGVGFHPYLRVAASVDQTRLELPAAAYLLADANGIPTGARPAVAGSEYDFRAPREVGNARLDTCFTELERAADELTRVRLEGPDGATELWADATCKYLMVFTADTLPPPRRRRAVAVEPMTCPPNALQSGQDLLVLEPGGSAAGRWGLRPLELG